MEFKYSSHAVNRMIERKISTQEVELVVKDPDGKIKQSKDFNQISKIPQLHLIK